MASFYVVRGQDHGKHFPVRGITTHIGRDSTNQIQLNDTEVSRLHAIVERTPESQFALRDCSSSNGTVVNGRAIQLANLRSGDRVQLGRSLMIFTGGPDVPTIESSEPVEIIASTQHEMNPIRGRADSQAGLAELLNSWQASSPLPSVQSPSSTAAQPAVASDLYGELIYQVSQVISRTLDIPQLLKSVLDLIFQWIECDRGCIVLVDDVNSELTPACSRRRIENSSTRPLQISRTMLDHVMHNREGVMTSNAQLDQRWTSSASIAGLGVREAICVPMQGRYGVHGAIYVDTEMSADSYALRNGVACFDNRQLKLIIAIAGQAALAIEDTQFYRAMLQSERLAAVGQTMANLSHHVKNILQGLSGGSYQVEDGLQKENLDVVRGGWAIVKKNQDRIGNLVMDMLSYSKERQPEFNSSDLSKLVSEVVELTNSRARVAEVQVTVHLPDQPVMVTMDSEGIHRALLNVVANAIDAASSAEVARPEGAQVAISAEMESTSQQVRIVVTDNGDGIQADQQLKIFTPFHSSKGARGTGLGLPVSQKILREHGGDITVQSDFGQGATFTLHWPAEAGAMTRNDSREDRPT